ncbi:DUF1553 domain-containing protein [Novipirellula artificiosorum]|uniref:Planctomycete cytochrome C n=1 Tax=Novipirellula artificiosorum TaxID=2528016 RepID=A0A5C6D6M0_9BACT|nr:DUF1553 domain-containing protein [Novipirellula artificiosorum]TWU32470.1 Planctomycete cytochrome C [Novipirellula artificiosorum]
MTLTKVAFSMISWLAILPLAAASERPISFNRDIRPILSDRCFACHGPDAETVEGGLRLDLPLEAIDAGAISPGNADESEMFRRILSDDEDEKMPPTHVHKPLDEGQIELIRRWIHEGAKYQPHWAYTPLRRGEIPSVQDTHWVRNDLDRFVLSKLEQIGVEPSPPADSVTLIRRLAFDLTGLPPTSTEVNAFAGASSEQAYQDLVRRFLDSPRFGERMAIYWLDLVRYADTVGYHGDQNVSQSPYRDYVIHAFNNGLPYDQFVREQLAGDLLPNPTIDQLVASGYNRLNQTTEEGGAQSKEYLAIYFADRVRNVSQVFMGATLGCAQCHDHKYDPYTSKDFYALGAFFADLEEKGVYSARVRPPEIPVPSAAEQKALDETQAKIDKATETLQSLKRQLLKTQAEWERGAVASLSDTHEAIVNVWIDDAQDTGGESSGTWNFVASDKAPVHSGQSSRIQSGDGIVQHYFVDAEKSVTVEADMQLWAWVYLDPNTPPRSVMLQFHDGHSWDHRAAWGTDDINYGRRPEDWNGYRRRGGLPELGKWVRLEVDAAEVGFKPGDTIAGMAFTQFEGAAVWDDAGWNHRQGMPTRIAEILSSDPSDRDPAQSKQLSDYYLSVSPSLVELNAVLDRLQTEQRAILESATTTVVSRAVSPRPVRLLRRGDWMDDTGEIVEPAIPEFLGSLDVAGRPATRLDLANWLCQSDNVLSSRTMVNRLWYLMFGRGLCESIDDFGGQGSFPSHPELLDYLAVEFVESNWNIKHIMELIANSSVYRQSSKPSPNLRSTDPYNEWFARQGRFRISAEMVRDNALLLSGLLVEQIGGPSTRPYQPSGYYDQLNFPRRQYVADKGPDQYRRGVYTHWQRTFLHPMLKAFDAPSREECTAMRSRSNTPLQALTLLNDPTFVEAARALAARIMREGGSSVDEKIGWSHLEVLSRKVDSFVADELRQIYLDHRVHYEEHAQQAKDLVSIGDSPVAEDLDTTELAAWTGVARVLLNLQETIMRY